MPIWNIILKNNIKIEKYEKLVNKIKNTPEIDIINKYLPNLNISHHKNTINGCIGLLYLINYPVKYHIIMKIDIDKYGKYIIEYTDNEKKFYNSIIKNINKPIKIIQYVKYNYL